MQFHLSEFGIGFGTLRNEQDKLAELVGSVSLSHEDLLRSRFGQVDEPTKRRYDVLAS